MNKTIFSILILSTLLSCNRKSELKTIGPDDFKGHNEELRTKSEPLHFERPFPFLKIHPRKSTLKILNSESKVLKEIELKIKQNPFVRKKLLSLVKDRYSENVIIDDLFKFSFIVSPSEYFKIINNYKFSELNNLRGIITTMSYLKYESDGLLEDLGYSSGIENSQDSISNFSLENSPEQTEGFEFGAKPKEAYEFKISSQLLKDLFKKLLKSERVLYSLDEFTLDNVSINKWKSEILEKGSLLIISEKQSERTLFIPQNSNVEDVLKKNSIDIKTISSHKKINFLKLNEIIRSGEIIALVNTEDEIDQSEMFFSEYKNVKDVKFTKIKNRNAHLYIQLKGVKHSIFHWYQPQRIIYLTNGRGRVIRECNVSRRKVKKDSIDLIPKKEKLSFSLNYNGMSKSINSLIETGDAKVEVNDNSLHIILYNLPGTNDKSGVLFKVNSSLSMANLVQDKGQCNLIYSSETNDVEGAFETTVREEVFESFKPSSRKELVGIEKSMNIITVL